MANAQALFDQADRKQLEADQARQKVELLEDQIRKTTQDLTFYQQQYDEASSQATSLREQAETTARQEEAQREEQIKQAAYDAARETAENTPRS